MKLNIKLKKRWITSVLKQAETAERVLPWQQGRNGLTSSIRGANAPQRPRLVKA